MLHGTDLFLQISDSAVNPIPDHLSAEEPSVTEDQELDSFRPLIGQLADQSSCLAVDHMDTAMQQLVGQPSAHSSVIGQLPGLPVSVSLDQGGWDSTLSRMIGQLSHQSSSHWLSGGQDFYAGQLMGQMASEPSTTGSWMSLLSSTVEAQVKELAWILVFQLKSVCHHSQRCLLKPRHTVPPSWAWIHIHSTTNSRTKLVQLFFQGRYWWLVSPGCR